MKLEKGDTITVNPVKTHVRRIFHIGAKRFEELVGTKGKVLSVEEGDFPEILIEFEVMIHGHDGGKLGKDGHCWFFFLSEEEIELLFKKENDLSHYRVDAGGFLTNDDNWKNGLSLI